MGKLKIKLLEGGYRNDNKIIRLLIDSKALFTGRVDLCALKTWLVENEKLIKECGFPMEKINGCSLAEQSYFFYENADADDDHNIDAMYEYRESHCLRFACRGIDFPDIYIGKNDGDHEISLYNDGEKWRYFFDIDDFYINLL